MERSNYKALKQENLQLAVFTAFNILANYKFPLNEALCFSALHNLEIKLIVMEQLLQLIIDEIIDDSSKNKIESTLGSFNNCIPLSVFSAKLLTLFGIESYPIEACALVYPDSTKDEFHMIGDVNLNGHQSYGHMVTFIPAENMIVDFSLCFQQGDIKQVLNAMISSAGQPTDATYYFPSRIGRSVPVGTGVIKWEVFKDAKGWEQTEWDLEEILSFATNRFDELKNR
tara:strand:+ start:16648 stop:17331 length:684 start_codon:yes stop_codon:yes gene_type:complete